MASLLDIAPSVKTVKVQGKDIPVYGVSATGVASLIERFPEFKALLVNRKPKDLTPEKLMKLIPDAIAAVIAAGTGLPGDLDAEEIAGKLAVGDQMELLACIVELTMPDGAAPFVERLQALTEKFGMGPVTK